MTPSEYTETLRKMREEAEQAAKDLPPKSNVVPFPARSDRWTRKYTRPMPPDGPEAA